MESTTLWTIINGSEYQLKHLWITDYIEHRSDDREPAEVHMVADAYEVNGTRTWITAAIWRDEFLDELKWQIVDEGDPLASPSGATASTTDEPSKAKRRNVMKIGQAKKLLKENGFKESAIDNRRMIGPDGSGVVVRMEYAGMASDGKVRIMWRIFSTTFSRVYDNIDDLYEDLEYAGLTK